MISSMIEAAVFEGIANPKGAKIETLMRKFTTDESGDFEENNDEFINEDFN